MSTHYHLCQTFFRTRVVSRNGKFKYLVKRCCHRDSFNHRATNVVENETYTRESDEPNIHPANSSASEINEKQKSESDNADKSPPLSYLGLGFGEKTRFWRHVLKKAVEPQKEPEKQKDQLPASVKVLWQHLPSEFKSQYPEIESVLKDDPVVEYNEEEDKPLQYPFQLARSVLQKVEVDGQNTAELTNLKGDKLDNENRKSHIRSRRLKQDAATMYVKHRNFFKFVEEVESSVDNDSDESDVDVESVREYMWEANYGVPDPTTKVSKIPCGGCGALLHCVNTALPGYMPSEKFKSLTENELRREQCQRCLYLQHFNIALNVTVNPQDYPKILEEIRKKNALVVLMVDLMDFPCSIWPGFVDLIGENCPIVVAGNKVDLLPKDQKGYLNRVEAALAASLIATGVDRGRNIKHIELISAKTGYGVENLITVLQTHQRRRDVYLVGCTNAGKSTLFNALLQSDFCKVRAVDLVQRATTSAWPGTTLNLLKFPILYPSGWKLQLRNERLAKQAEASAEEDELRRKNYKATKHPQYATLIGRIGMTFYRNQEAINSVLGLPTKRIKHIKTDVFDPNDPDFAAGRFCYDTPGAIYEDQILDLLTAEEIIKVIPKQIITPRSFSLRPLQTLFLAGLGRIDVVEAENHVIVTVFASEQLPIHIVDTVNADKFYSSHLGSGMLMVPFGGAERLKDFPVLKAKRFEITGISYQQSSADVILSSAGWVAVAHEKGTKCVLKAYTPDGRGCHLRNPPVSHFSVMLKGRRIRGTPAYENKKYAVVL